MSDREEYIPDSSYAEMLRQVVTEIKTARSNIARQVNAPQWGVIGI